MSDSFINIKKLPEVTEVNNGDYMLLETSDGTQILDFKNFIITEYNTTFQSLLSTFSDNVNANLANINTLSASTTTLSSIWKTDDPTFTAINTLCSVGINIPAGSAAGEKLTVSGNISANGSILCSNLSAIGTSSVHFNGNVGIGTTAPNATLHVADTDGRIRVEATADNHPGFEISEAGTRKWVIYNNPDFNDNLTFKTDTTRRVVIQQDGSVGIGTDSPETLLHIASTNACITLNETSSTPTDPTVGSEGRIYIKGDKLVIQFNDAGNVRYKYLDLTGTGVTWTHTTTAP